MPRKAVDFKPELHREARPSDAVAMVRSLDSSAHTLTAVVSTKQVDRYGSIILPSAFSGTMDLYMLNPVILWSHNPSAPPIGRAVDYRITDEGLELEIEFAVNENPMAAQVWRLYEGGYLKGFSVGGYMRGYVGSWSSEELKATLPQYAQDALKAGTCDFVITLMELLEVSACAIPANPGALKKAVEDGALSPTLALSLENPTELRLQLIEARICELEGLFKAREAPPSDNTPEEVASAPEPCMTPQAARSEGSPPELSREGEILFEEVLEAVVLVVKTMIGAR